MFPSKMLAANVERGRDARKARAIPAQTFASRTTHLIQY